MPQTLIIQAAITPIMARYPPLSHGPWLVVVAVLILRFFVVVVVEGASTERYIQH